MMVKCQPMMVKRVYDHTLISPSLTSISLSLTNILPSLAHLTIIEKLHRLLQFFIELLFPDQSYLIPDLPFCGTMTRQDELCALRGRRLSQTQRNASGYIKNKFVSGRTTKVWKPPSPKHKNASGNHKNRNCYSGPITKEMERRGGAE